jgi:hypothetical protein
MSFSTQWEMICPEILLENKPIGKNLEDMCMTWRATLKRILKTEHMRVWAGFNWLRAGPPAGFCEYGLRKSGKLFDYLIDCVIRRALFHDTGRSEESLS